LVLLLVSPLVPGAGARTSWQPVISVGPVRATEGDEGEDAVFALRLSREGVSPVSVRFATANGSARGGADYVARRGVVIFKHGQRSKYVHVRVVGDTLPEPEETFFLVLSRPRGATLKTQRATATIAASDLPAPFTLRATMTGAEYVPPPGDPTGSGTLALLLDAEHEQVTYTITVTGMKVGLSGVCQGARGEAPAAVLRLDYPPQATESRHLALTTILAMFQDPEGFCAQARPDLAAPGIRGQFVPA
jgi:hypothetical protein